MAEVVGVVLNQEGGTATALLPTQTDALNWHTAMGPRTYNPPAAAPLVTPLLFCVMEAVLLTQRVLLACRRKAELPA